MSWTFAAQLDDEFAQVRLYHLYAGGFKRLIEFDLLAHHRLGFNDQAGIMLFGDLRSGKSCCMCIEGTVNLYTVFLCAFDELRKIFF